MHESQPHLFDMQAYMPHGQCYLWQSDLLLLHTVSDALIVLSYYSIPFAMVYVLKRRQDIQFGWVYWLFGLFIFLCGTTHLLSIWNVWVPDYWASGLVKLATAAASLTTAVLIWPLIPKILAIPSQSQLMAANAALAKEIDNHRKTERELRKLSLAMQYSSSMVIITDHQAKVEYCNPAFYRITGFTEQEVIGHKANLLKSDLTANEIYDELWQTLNAGQDWHGEFLNRKKNGDLFWCLESITPILDDDNAISHFVSIIHDISDRKDSEEIIKHLAYFDPLTDLPNRALFNERLAQSISQARRHRTEFALLYMDLDRFKNINDTLGHLVGDKLLIEVGKRVTACLREHETVARLGGDEFAIIGLNLRTATDAGEIARRVIEQVNQAFFIDDHQLFIGTSLGIGVYPADGENSETLIKHADDALYQAKQRGRNKFEFYDASANALSLRRVTLEQHLHQALARGEFQLRYLPLVALPGGAPVGVEVLLRWHPDIGEVQPDEFIPIAEDSGLIVEIGAWVLRTACRDILTLPAAAGLMLAINLSPRQFKQPDLMNRIDAILAETGFPPSRLEFEITESMLMDNLDSAITQMRAMKSRGMRLSIDDFGTGFSSLNYLRKLPVDTLKIDKSFVGDLGTETGDACIVRSIVGLAHGIHLRVVAEGVENERQTAMLGALGCDLAQGFHFSPPLNLAELRGYLETGGP
ncbi:EAL domain-containing protein [Methylomonas sp. UP202]|uniref:putative bifunctional diguanylate cyclase/phosphodiesterase n=1 Tax=Methylomonas sp. UP202 TaxID=3040943 RepID=UPI00247A66DC|nr:EAL domain-containing protein [Methylomonas sp. UP202]WGS86710.1 EAL domain-containing protein [Methylomonas sp. UP202]